MISSFVVERVMKEIGIMFQKLNIYACTGGTLDKKTWLKGLVDFFTSVFTAFLFIPT